MIVVAELLCLRKIQKPSKVTIKLNIFIYLFIHILKDCKKSNNYINYSLSSFLILKKRFFFSNPGNKKESPFVVLNVFKRKNERKVQSTNYLEIGKHLWLTIVSIE